MKNHLITNAEGQKLPVSYCMVPGALCWVFLTTTELLDCIPSIADRTNDKVRTEYVLKKEINGYDKSSTFFSFFPNNFSRRPAIGCIFFLSPARLEARKGDPHAVKRPHHQGRSPSAFVASLSLFYSGGKATPIAQA